MYPASCTCFFFFFSHNVNVCLFIFTVTWINMMSLFTPSLWFCAIRVIVFCLLWWLNESVYPAYSSEHAQWGRSNESVCTVCVLLSHTSASVSLILTGPQPHRVRKTLKEAGSLRGKPSYILHLTHMSGDYVVANKFEVVI